jgi:site-specific DNA-methyltransferase (adenine-specific)
VTPYYDDGSCVIYHGDCRDVLPLISGSAVVTDPPYGVGKSYGDNYDDNGGPEYWDFIRSVIAMCRQSASVVAMTHRVLALRELTDWDWVCGWVKRNQQMRLFSMPILPTWEPILCWGIKGLEVKHRADTFHVDAVQPATVPGGHPFPKPSTLIASLVTWLCPRGGTVIDPFLGSGTTLRVAKDLGYRSVGIEIEERYCEIAAKRLAQEVLDFGGVA